MTEKKFLDIFAREAQEHLAHLRQGILHLEQAEVHPESLHGLLRSAHTLKGASRMVGLADISRLAHALEDAVKLLEEGGRSCDAAMVDVLLLTTDMLEAMVGQALTAVDGSAGAPFDLEAMLASLRSGAPPADRRLLGAAASAADQGPGLADDSVRISVDRLDRLVNLLGEGSLAVARLERHGAMLQSLERELETFLAGLRREKNYRTVRGILSHFQDFRRQMDDHLMHFQGLGETLAQEAHGLRMVPLATLAEDLRRVVRDLARAQGKDVHFEVSGEETALDRLVWDVLRPSLIHMLRNALDHGIETPRERRAAGKPPRGTIQLSARYERRGVCITLADDGRGIDPALVRQIAVARGLLQGEEAAALSDQDVLYLILRPGFSTRSDADDVSGRGIGMDVVRAGMDRIKGNLLIHSAVGLGTEIQLELPLTLARLSGLVIRCESERYVLPLQYVHGVLHLGEDDILFQAGRERIRYEGRSRPLFTLRELLGEAQQSAYTGTRIPAVMMRCREQYAAWAVSDILGVQDVVVKSLGPHLSAVGAFAGAAVLGDGLPALIPAVPELFAGARLGVGGQVRGELAAARARKKRGRVLVVDDSITTRAMEKNILESCGYQVGLAMSGEEALDLLAENRFDLIVTDIEMPGMDGFELTRQLRQSESHADVPVIIVSSRASDEDKRRGIEVGAQAYIVKGSFDQGKLIEAVETLIG